MFKTYVVEIILPAARNDSGAWNAGCHRRYVHRHITKRYYTFR